MRLLVVAVLALALGLGALWLAGDRPRSERGGAAPVRPEEASTAVTGTDRPRDDVAPTPAPSEPSAARAQPVAEAPLLPPPRGEPIALAADVYLAQGDGTLLPGVIGHFELSVFAGGALERQRVAVEAGAATCFVPERSTLRLLEGELNGQRVRFAKPAGPFAPRGNRLALVGEVLPRNVVRVLAAGTGADLVDVTVREVDGPGGGRATGDTAQRSAPLLTGVRSPVALPWVDTRRPLWLEFTAPGYAPARALIDPRRAGERTLSLHPAAGPLTIHVTGPGRGQVDGLVVQRFESDAERPVVAHLHCGAVAEGAPDPRRFELEALPVGRVLVRATFLDARALSGTVQDLAKAEVLLQPGAAARVDLFVPLP